MTLDQYIEIVDYLNKHLSNWYVPYVPEMVERKITWAEVGFLAAWMGFRFKGEENANTTKG